MVNESALSQGAQIRSLANRVWRFLGTALSFGLFGFGGLLLSVLAFPLLWLLLRNPERRQRSARRLVTGAFAAFVEFMRLVGVLDYRLQGMEERRDLDGCLILANHPSLIDVVFLLSVFRDADCVVKSAHWSNPFTMGPVRMAGFISNRDPQLLLDECVARLRQGRHLLMFPEGTRTVPGERLRFLRGAATVAVRAGAPCLPVLVSCKPTTLTKNEAWYAIPKRRVQFELKALPIVRVEAYTEGRELRQASQDLNRYLQGLFEAQMTEVRSNSGT